MKSTTKLSAMALAAMLVLSVVAPAAMAATAAGNTSGNVAVETGEAEDVTNSSAMLNGEVEGLDENASADVHFEVSGNNSSMTVDAGNASGEFSASVSGLENNTSYTYVAYATVNNTTYSGEEATFTTGAEENADDASEDAFGQDVSAFVHDLLENRDDSERGIGQQVSAYVLENNPAADKIPDHAGPSNDRGPDSETERGPPEDAGPDWKDDGDDSDDEDADADSEDDDSDDSEDDHPGNGNAHGKK